ncbi:MAG: ABC transporter ATP-binding protein [Blastocatellia bacterium]|nr:ABC transporter ATP-binding protein [Blastocatellia bacterium]
MKSEERLLSATGLCRTYVTATERLTIFENLFLTISKGEQVAITGASGVGKSTLLHLLGGLDRPTAGTVTINGTDIWQLRAPELARFRNTSVGFVFQFHHLLPEFSAVENIQMPMLMQGISRNESAKRAETLLDRVGLSTRRHHRPAELSGGESQRIALARALANNPPLLLADEPTGNLDERTGESIHTLLTELHGERGLTSVIVTHNPALAARCDRVLHFEHGQLQT